MSSTRFIHTHYELITRVSRTIFNRHKILAAFHLHQQTLQHLYTLPVLPAIMATLAMLVKPVLPV